MSSLSKIGFSGLRKSQNVRKIIFRNLSKNSHALLRLKVMDERQTDRQIARMDGRTIILWLDGQALALATYLATHKFNTLNDHYYYFAVYMPKVTNYL